MLRRMTNYHNSISHRLPPEILAAMASHLENDESLLTATYVCHFWRSALISSPRLWSHLTFENERRAAVFLERSRSAPVSVDLRTNNEPSEAVMKSLVGITNRLTSLRGAHVPFLDELLVQPLPILRNLDVVTSGTFPSVVSLASTNLGRPMFHVPLLTRFCFKLCRCSGSAVTTRMGDGLLDFLRSCPQLEVIHFGYGDQGADIGFTTNEASTKAVSLPRLRSFTHESPVDTIYIGLFNRLSLPPTCEVEFTIRDIFFIEKPWNCGFPTLRDPSYLSDVKTVKIAFHAQKRGTTMVKTTFSNSKNMKISFNRLSISSTYSNSVWVIEKFLNFLGGSEMARCIETLHFEGCPILPRQGHFTPRLTKSLMKLGNLKTLVLWQCNPAFFLISPCSPAVWCPRIERLVISPVTSTRPWEESDVSRRVRDIAVSRQKHATPLKTVTLVVQDTERLLLTCRGVIEELKSCVGSVEIVESSV